VERARDPRLDYATWHCLVLSDVEGVSRLVCRLKPDLVVHLASLVTGSRERSLVLPALEANLRSTVNLIDVAAATGVSRFLQLGSMEEPPLDTPPAPPVSPYQAAKMAATSYCRMYADLYRLDAVIARVFMVYGPGYQDEQKLIPHVIRSLLTGASVQLSSGVRRVDWIFVDDLISGLVRLLAARGVAGRVVDFGSGHMVPVRDVVEQIYLALGRKDAPPFGTLPDRPGEPEPKADLATTEALLGWRPEIPMAEGLARTIEWFRSH
jgi:nucleoside-diphosphate-sugar epimerase